MNPLVVAGVGLSLAAVGSTTLSLSQALLRSETTQVRELAETVGALDLDLDTGDVRVEASRRSGVTIERTETWSLTRPSVQEDVVGETLRVRADCAALLSWCDVSYVLRVPLGTTVSARSGSGSLTLSGTGEVRADTGSGDVVLSRVTGGATVRSGSGEVTADDVSGPSLSVRTGSGDIQVARAGVGTLTARTGSGDVRLGAAVAPDGVRAETGSGDVRVRVPAGLAYAVAVDTGSGEPDVAVQTDPASPRQLVLRTGSGDLQVAYG